MTAREVDFSAVERALRQPDAFVPLTIALKGVEREITVEVLAKWHEGESRTYSHPGSPRGWEIEEVKFEGTYLTHLLSERQLDAIARELT